MAEQLTTTRATRRRPVAVNGVHLLGYGLAKFIPGIANLASVAAWIRLVGASEYGAFSLVWIVTLVTTSIGVKWVGQAAMRATGDASRALGLLPRLPLAAAVVASTIPVLGWALFVVNEVPARGMFPFVSSAVLSCLATGAYLLLVARAQRDQRSVRFAVAESVRAVVGLVASLLLLPWIPGATGLLTATTLATCTSIVILAPRLPRLLVPRPSSPGLLGEYWRYGWPMAGWFGASIAQLYGDRFVVASLLGTAEAGRYTAVADMIIRGIGMVAFPITIAVHSSVMGAWNTGDPERARALLSNAARVLALVLTPCVAMVAVAGPWAFDWLTPGHSVPGGTMILLALGSSIWQCALLAHKPLEIAGRTTAMFGFILAATALTLALDIALVPLWGVAGAAFAYTAGAAAYTGACLLSARLSDRPAPGQATTRCDGCPGPGRDCVHTIERRPEPMTDQIRHPGQRTLGDGSAPAPAATSEVTGR